MHLNYKTWHGTCSTETLNHDLRFKKTVDEWRSYSTFAQQVMKDLWSVLLGRNISLYCLINTMPRSDFKKGEGQSKILMMIICEKILMS